MSDPENSVLRLVKGIVVDFFQCARPVDEQTHYNAYRKMSRWRFSDGLELEGLIGRLSDHFGLEDVSASEWQRFFTSAPDFTILELSSFISRRMKCVRIVSTHDEETPVFDALRIMVKQTLKRDIQIQPSTAIEDLLRGYKLDVFWRRVRAFADNVPKLEDAPRAAVPLVCVIVGVLIVAGGVWLHRPLAFILLGGVAVALIYEVRAQHRHKVPAALKTFSDLVTHVLASGRSEFYIVYGVDTGSGEQSSGRGRGDESNY